MLAAEPRSELQVQCSSTRLGCFLLSFAPISLRDPKQVPCPLWASISLSVNTWELDLVLPKVLMALAYSEKRINGWGEGGNQDRAEVGP